MLGWGWIYSTISMFVNSILVNFNVRDFYLSRKPTLKLSFQYFVTGFDQSKHEQVASKVASSTPLILRKFSSAQGSPF